LATILDGEVLFPIAKVTKDMLKNICAQHSWLQRR
jgi:hypothetical protein